MSNEDPVTPIQAAALWEHHIGVTGDAKEWYTLQLDYNFTRTS
jgi:hypothetical protein